MNNDGPVALCTWCNEDIFDLEEMYDEATCVTCHERRKKAFKKVVRKPHE